MTLLHIDLTNRTPAQVKIERIDLLIGKESRALADAVAVQIAPRPAGQAGYAPGGVYLARPLRGFEPGYGCLEQPLVEPHDCVVRPASSGDSSWLAITLDGRSPGWFEIDGQRVVYSVGRERYVQDLRFEYDILVSDAAQRTDSADEECIGSA